MFFETLETFDSDIALRDSANRTLTYGDLARASDRLGAMLGPARTVVAIECTNRIETVIAYLAALRSDHVALMIDGELADDVREGLYARFGVGAVVSTGATGDEVPVRRRPGPIALAAAGLAELLSTSGSTGSPKLVRLSARSVDANARSIATYLSLGPGERSLLSLPLNYSYGLSVLNSHLAVGATLVLCEEPVTGRGFWNLLKESQATSIAGVPAMWDMLQQLRFARMQLSSLSYCTQAGGRLSIPAAKYFADWSDATGKKFFVMYGQTEATARMSYVPPERLQEKLGSIGVAIPGGALSLMDADGRVIDDAGTVGEIEFTGPNVMWGYAESMDDLQLGDELHGVLRTGDLGRRDSDGYYFIEGRTKRFAKVFGNRINLDEVESLLNRHGIVNAVTQRDERLLIGVTDAGPAEVLQLVCAALRIHHSGAHVFRLDAVPRSAAGKVLYPEVERLAGLGAATGAVECS